ncbi:NADH-quinone oxidoreductase subunit C [Propionivibrio limicola]|uniref:hydrogenase large subunit n=1 Tax=Propionivibrio limicola TaxID=167645 RepID=UPI001290BA8D|nr:NADH-quinone oxidoreductase subunit C [Propionivibrio limicola]
MSETAQFFDLPITFTRQPEHVFPAWEAEADEAALEEFCIAAHRAGRRLVALWGCDKRDRQPDVPARGFALHVALDLAEGLACLTLPMDACAPRFPDLAPIFPSAGRLQRAVRDMIGAEPVSSEYPTDLRPWLRHANWPADYFPLRHDTPDASFPAQNETYGFVRVDGDGVHEVAVGPIHAGVIEPGHFRFSAMGERVLRLEERLGWKHKGIERRFVGMALAEGARLAGRVSGDTTVAYAWAYSQAAEAIAGVTPPARAIWLRALLLERERIANHLGDLGGMANDVAFSFGLMQFSRLKEDWLRLNARLFGHRYLMDRIVPGGIAIDLSASGAAELIEQCDTIQREVRALKAIYDEHAGLQDRFLTTGHLAPERARQLGTIGLVGRASDQHWDLRVDHPCAPYDELETRVATHANGDVAARALVRFAELNESLHLIRKILSGMPSGDIRCDVRSAPERRGFGWIEGWRGDVLVMVETGLDGKIRRCHCHDPSWHNWIALEHAAIDNIVPDFPVINKSFNLSYAGPDL